MSNNADIAKSKLRELQSAIYSYRTTREQLFRQTEEIAEILDKASREIRTNYDTIAARLADKLNGGANG
jgi:hypothetical protein